MKATSDLEGTQKTWPSRATEDQQALLDGHGGVHVETEMHDLQPPPAYSAEPGPNFPSGHAPNQDTLPGALVRKPGFIRRVYQGSNIFLIGQWLMAACMLGSSIVVLHRRTGLPAITPYAAVAVASACVMVLCLPLRLRYKSASKDTPRPPVSYTIGMGVTLVLWAASVACGGVGMSLAAPYKREIDEASRNPEPCGGRHQRSCFEYTERALEYTRSIIFMSFAATGLVLGVGQAYKLSKLWRGEFPAHVVRGDYASVQVVKKVSFRDAWKEGWRRGRESH